MNSNAEFLRVWEETEALRQQAERLYPRHIANQAAWVKAMQTVRSTRDGYLLDKPVQRLKEQLQ